MSKWEYKIVMRPTFGSFETLLNKLGTLKDGKQLVRLLPPSACPALCCSSANFQTDSLPAGRNMDSE